MFMAPDSWKGLYENTLMQVKDGTIPMERLDDAVRRILRVKISSGIFEKGILVLVQCWRRITFESTK